MKRAIGMIAVLGLAAPACGVPFGEPTTIGPTNACDGASDCGPGAACVQGQCVATEYDLEGLLLEVRPHANATFGANTSFMIDPSKSSLVLTSRGSSDAPFDAGYDLTLPMPVSVRDGVVRVNSKTSLEANCSLGADRAVPAHVTFYRVQPFVGLPIDPIAANIESELDLDLVPGIYDIYVEPHVVANCNDQKPYPPVLFTGQQIAEGASFSWEMPVLGALTGPIHGFGEAVSGPFTVDVVEPSRGLVVSVNATLTPAADGYEVSTQLAWQGKSMPILRLTPPDSSALPTAYWQLSNAGGSQTNPEIDYALEGLFQDPVQIGGHVVGTDLFTSIPSSLTIHSTALMGSNAENAVYAIQNHPTDAQGAFSILLPPGDAYNIRVFPADDGLAVTDIERGIPSQPSGECICGQTLKLEAKLRVSGMITTPSGEALSGADVALTPTQQPTKSYWESTHVLSPAAIRPATATTTEGLFDVLVDPGTADITIQPAEGSGFPWLVVPGLEISAHTEHTSLALKYPAILRGTVRDPRGVPLGNADINAWYAVRGPGGVATGTAIKIASTTTDADGSYTLVMPSSI